MIGDKTKNLWTDECYRHKMVDSHIKYDIDLDILKNEYLSGKTTTYLANKYGCGVNAIIYRLKRVGVSKFRRGNPSQYRNYSKSGWKMPEKAKDKIRQSQIGDKNNNWKGGVTKEEHVLRLTSPYKNWKLQVFKRDNFTCQECGMKNKNLECHHIKSFAEYPKLRMDIDNAISLCKKCHLKTKTREKMFEQRYTEMIKKQKQVIING